ncbi:kinase-like protein [Mycena floridula]|nr:kinase-like protein [Mycena floridula]
MKIVNRDPPQAQKQRKLKQNRPDYVAVVDKIHTIETKIRREIAIMKKCRHPHVVRLLEVIDDRQKSSIYMVMEFLGGGEISWKDNDEKPILSVDQSRRIIRDAILGLEYLHYYGIIHRDIKPANLVWTKNREHVKIADFGVAHSSYAQRLSAGLTDDDEDVPLLMNDSELAQRAGTPPFLAPEVVYEYTERSDGLPRPHITKSIDIWALGVTLYCFLFGHLPFKPPPDAEGNSISFEAATYRMICNYDWIAPPMMGYDEIPTGGRHPEDALSLGGIVIELLDHCLEKDMAMRITLQEIKVLL